MKKLFLAILTVILAQSITIIGQEKLEKYELKKQLYESINSLDLKKFKSLYEENKNSFYFYEKFLIVRHLNIKLSERFAELGGGKANDSIALKILGYTSIVYGMIGLLLSLGDFDKDKKELIRIASLIITLLGFTLNKIRISDEEANKIRENIKEDKIYNEIFSTLKSI